MRFRYCTFKLETKESYSGQAYVMLINVFSVVSIKNTRKLKIEGNK